MTLELKRETLNEQYTVGKLFINGVYFCDTLEDVVRDINKNGIFDGKETKIKGETAIPYGMYEVIVTVSPRFKRELPRLLNVPNFEGILIHSGNYAKDTEGCILVGENKVKGGLINSRKYSDELVQYIKQALKTEKVFIKIT